MRVAIYSRVSTASQAEEGFSLEAQYDQLMKYVQANGWDLVRVYTDPGVSAKDLNRPGVQEMLRDMRAKKFEAIVVHKLDRLTRNISDLHMLVEEVNKLNIKLISLTENIDTSTAMGRLFVYFLGIIAQMFRENLSEEVKKGMRKRAELGLRNTFAPFGYRMDENGRLIVMPEEAEIVRKIFDLYVNRGYGFQTIARIMNQQHQSGLRGGAFHGSTIEGILQNYTYIGKNHWKPKNAPESQRIIRDADHEPIVSVELFMKAQERMQRRSKKDMSRSSYEYPYSTVLRCGRCGSPFHGQIRPFKNTKYYHYKCYGKQVGKCDQSQLSEIKLDQLFFQHLAIMEEEIKLALKPKDNQNEVRRKQIERELERSERRRKNWQYAFGDGKLPYEDYVRLIDEEMNRVEKLRAELESLPVDETVQTSSEEIWFMIRQMQVGWSLVDRETKKKFINGLFSSITIDKQNGEWKILDIKFV